MTEGQEFKSADWEALEKLRERFLNRNTQEDYWDHQSLELYDASFAQRIGWKWDFVLDDLEAGTFRPKAGALIDFGCGTGIATEKLRERFHFSDHIFLDRSQNAVQFCQDKFSVAPKEVPTEGYNLAISHLISETSEPEMQKILDLCKKAETIFWVEPGEKLSSRKLLAVREQLISSHSVVAPCPLSTGSCPLALLESDWCHQFAQTPGFIHQDSFWSKFSTKLGIDLRSLPVSYLVMTQLPVKEKVPYLRSLGHPRMTKHDFTIDTCSGKCFERTSYSKKEHKELFKAAKKHNLVSRLPI